MGESSARENLNTERRIAALAVTLGAPLAWAGASIAGVIALGLGATVGGFLWGASRIRRRKKDAEKEHLTKYGILRKGYGDAAEDVDLLEDEKYEGQHADWRENRAQSRREWHRYQQIHELGEMDDLLEDKKITRDRLAEDDTLEDKKKTEDRLVEGDTLEHKEIILGGLGQGASGKKKKGKKKKKVGASPLIEKIKVLHPDEELKGDAEKEARDPMNFELPLALKSSARPPVPSKKVEGLLRPLGLIGKPYGKPVSGHRKKKRIG